MTVVNINADASPLLFRVDKDNVGTTDILLRSRGVVERRGGPDREPPNHNTSIIDSLMYLYPLSYLVYMEFAFSSLLEVSSVLSPATRIIISEYRRYHNYHTILSCIWRLQRENQI